LGQNDGSSGSRTLPLAELNPLLNPVLAENMGRWAEVYFTSPPERREQAVSELLRELEVERSGQDEESNRALDSESVRTPVKASAHIRCDACGRENSVSNKYCGMCGAGLGEARPYSIVGDNYSRTAFGGQEYSPHARTEEGSAEEQVGISARERHREQAQYDEENRDESYPVPHEFGHALPGNRLSLFQAPADTPSGEDESVDWADEPEASPSYRYHIGAVLAVIILVLGYMAWRGTQASQNSHEVSAPPPAAASDTAPAATATPAPSTQAAKTTAEEPSQPPAPDASEHTSAPEGVQKSPPEAKSPHHQVAKSAPAPAVPSPDAATAPQTQPAAGNGGEELAIAERYLNGAVGQKRDTAEAARWLWKSVAKHNGQATVLLSDLYLKGEGVSKNCDQARVLLDSAARKGAAGAGERLRNLPAFGCQ
jgi:ribosomal protein L37E